MREISSIEIKDEADVGAARRAVHEYAQRAGFDATELAEIDIVVQEIGTNAARYASGGGWLHFAMIESSDEQARALELFYCDKGPGIYDLDRAIRDGVSTSGSNSLGAGLGAIRRLMDEFDIYSTVASTARLAREAAARRTTHGTALLTRKWLGNQLPAAADDTKRIGIWSRPHPDETANGDAYFIRKRGAQTLFAVIDGLGHGHGAKQAADVAIDALDEWQGEPLDQVIETTHNALRATRGAVMGAAIIDANKELFHYAGVGNVEVRVFDTPEPFSPISVNGTLGSRLGRVRVWTNPWTDGATLVMASDGISASWNMVAYPGLLRHSPQLLAGILMRDYSRRADDATVLVIK